MNYEMHLNEEPFNMIKEGIKTIEYRVNDEKRQKIHIGDTIIFKKRPLEKDTIKVIVTDLKYYNNLLDMYTASFDLYLKDMYKNPQECANETQYYSKEEIEKYGCVAIHFKKI